MEDGKISQLYKIPEWPTHSIDFQDEYFLINKYLILLTDAFILR